MHPNPDQLAPASKKPDLAVFRREYVRSRDFGDYGGKLARNDAIRLCRWEGQSVDGKKHAEAYGKEVFPFEGASDVRYRLADRTINEMAALLVTAWQRSVIRVGGTEVTDMSAAAIGTNLMRWITNNKLRNDLEREAELAAQYAGAYGWTAFAVTWEQQLGKRRQPVTIEEVMAAASQAQGVAAEMPQLIANPAAADQAAALLTAMVPEVTLVEAKRMVRELRDTGKTTLEQDYVVRNLPCVTALRPHDEICFPPETVDLQRARVIFRRQRMTEVELRSMAATDGWDPQFIEQAVTTLGKSEGGAESLLSVSAAGIDRQQNMIEIIYAYSRQISPDGVPAVYCTVFSPVVGESVYAKHELLDYAHGEYPFVEYRREITQRGVMESRGVPEICSTDQDEIKAQHDSIRDSTAFETLPPIKVAKRIGAINKIAPGRQLPVTRADDYEFMSPPARPPKTAFELIEAVEMKHSRYFGLAHANIPPTVTTMAQQLVVNKWLGTWRQVYRQMYSLCLQYLAPEEIQRITGHVVPQNLTDVAGEFDFIVTFDVREMDSDYLTAKLQSIAQFLVPLDTVGEIDRAALVRMLVECISPDAARELIVNQTGASEKVYRQIQSDIGLMMLGCEAQYSQNDPAAQMKLQYAEDIVRKNPKAQSQLQQDTLFQKLMQNYVQNLKMSVDQQKNAQIGRLGVTPVSDQLQEEQQATAPGAGPAPEPAMADAAPAGVA